MEQRLDWIDRAKGIGIILVILGHAVFPKELIVLLYSFHMPLFFFLSGYVYKFNNKISFKEYVVKKAKTLLVPAVALTIVPIIYSSILSIIRNNSVDIDIVKIIIGIFIQLRGSQFSTGHWFLICLFVSQIILYFIFKKNPSGKQLLYYAIGFSIVGYIYCRFAGFIVPWAVEVSFSAIGFLILGYLFSRKKELIDKFKNMRYLIIYIIINIVTCWGNYKLNNVAVDIYSNKYGNYLLYMISALSGIMAVIIIAKEIVKFKELSFIGRNSLIYYCLHFSIISTINMIKDFTYITEPSKQFTIGIMYLIINLVILHLLSSFINKYMPFLLGKFSFKKAKLKNNTELKY